MVTWSSCEIPVAGLGTHRCVSKMKERSDRLELNEDRVLSDLAWKVVNVIK